jgi:hypothetical protein
MGSTNWEPQATAGSRPEPVIAQDPTVTVDQASEMVADTRRLALSMFPDKELAFNLIYWPRLQRLMRERYRLQ